MKRRATPCVAVCSTTYGDLVCRGCKRFSHEVIAWNGYDAEQQESVWVRLETLRSGSVDKFIDIVDLERLERVTENRVDASQSPQMRAFYVIKNNTATLHQAGLRMRATVDDLPERLLLDAIEREFYLRSCAEYERSFGVRIQ